MTTSTPVSWPRRTTASAGIATPVKLPLGMRAVAETPVGQSADQFVEQSFFDYHLYTLQRKSTIKDNQTKQISLLESSGIRVGAIRHSDLDSETAIVCRCSRDLSARAIDL